MIIVFVDGLKPHFGCHGVSHKMAKTPTQESSLCHVISRDRPRDTNNHHKVCFFSWLMQFSIYTLFNAVWQMQRCPFGCREEDFPVSDSTSCAMSIFGNDTTNPSKKWSSNTLLIQATAFEHQFIVNCKWINHKTAKSTTEWTLQWDKFASDWLLHELLLLFQMSCIPHLFTHDKLRCSFSLLMPTSNCEPHAWNETTKPTMHLTCFFVALLLVTVKNWFLILWNQEFTCQVIVCVSLTKKKRPKTQVPKLSRNGRFHGVINFCCTMTFSKDAQASRPMPAPWKIQSPLKNSVPPEKSSPSEKSSPPEKFSLPWKNQATLEKPVPHWKIWHKCKPRTGEHQFDSAALHDMLTGFIAFSLFQLLFCFNHFAIISEGSWKQCQQMRSQIEECQQAGQACTLVKNCTHWSAQVWTHAHPFTLRWEINKKCQVRTAAGNIKNQWSWRKQTTSTCIKSHCKHPLQQVSVNHPNSNSTPSGTVGLNKTDAFHLSSNIEWF